MKRLILFSMVCLMTTITQAQNETTAENDSVAWDKMLSEISVTGHLNRNQTEIFAMV